MNRAVAILMSLQPGSCRRVLTSGGLVVLLLAGAFPILHAEPGRLEPAQPALREDTRGVNNPLLIAWTTGTGKWVGYWGRREAVRCPAGGRLEGVWGTDIYTDDSSICTAAVHAGLLSTDTGGTVTIEMRPDVGQYAGSSRYGVRTNDWMEPWTGAFVFVRDLSSAEPAIAATSHMQIESWAGQAGRRLSFSCPPFIELHTVYGTDLYTDDSYVCSAAVHAGIITRRDGGMVTVQLVKGVMSFNRVRDTASPANRPTAGRGKAIDLWRPRRVRPRRRRQKRPSLALLLRRSVAHRSSFHHAVPYGAIRIHLSPFSQVLPRSDR